MLPYMPFPGQEVPDEPNLEAGTYKNFRYAIIRTLPGHLCGYVEIPKDHAAYRQHYNALELSVHGGLTYSAEADPPFSGYWIGFDCAHSGDFIPNGTFGGTYRDFPYVRKECFKLIEQLITFSTKKFQLKQELLAVVARFNAEPEYPEWKEAIENLHL